MGYNNVMEILLQAPLILVILIIQLAINYQVVFILILFLLTFIFLLNNSLSKIAFLLVNILTLTIFLWSTIACFFSANCLIVPLSLFFLIVPFLLVVNSIFWARVIKKKKEPKEVLKVAAGPFLALLIVISVLIWFSPSTVYLSQEEVDELFSKCEVAQTLETHDSKFFVELKNGRSYESSKPSYLPEDELLERYERCGFVPSALE